MTLTRSLLAKSFPNNPRLRAELESLDSFLDDTSNKAQGVSDALDGLTANLGDGGAFQTASPILDSIAQVPNRVGALEFTNDGDADIRPIDGQDPASLLSRGAAYTVLVGIGGRGPTASRPAAPANAVALYFDTDLAADGKPIFWTGIAWVDSSGTLV